MNIFLLSCSTIREFEYRSPKFLYLVPREKSTRSIASERIWSNKYFITGVNATRFSSTDIKKIIAMKNKKLKIQLLKEKYFFQFNNKLKGLIGAYQVRYDSETPRMISYKLYAETDRFQDLKNLNPELTHPHEKLEKGTIIYYLIPKKSVVWTPEGLPFQIRKNYSVERVSKDIYNSMSKWMKLFTQNSLLIDDYKKIQEGDILFWLPEWYNDMDPANRRKISRMPMSSTDVEFYYIKEAKDSGGDGIKKEYDEETYRTYEEFR